MYTTLLDTRDQSNTDIFCTFEILSDAHSLENTSVRHCISTLHQINTTWSIEQMYYSNFSLFSRESSRGKLSSLAACAELENPVL